MFKNIGKKIKALASVICWVGNAIFVSISGYLLLSDPNDTIVLIISLILLIVGPLFSWLVTCCLYAFGELVSKTCEISEILQVTIAQTPAIPSTISPATSDTLDKWLENGLISKEEYDMKKEQQ